MKIPYLVILTACASATSAYATGLNPASVVEASTAYRNNLLQPPSYTAPSYTPATNTAATASYEVNTRLSLLESELVQLRSKVDAQIQEVNNLKNVQQHQGAVIANVDQRLSSLTGTATTPVSTGLLPSSTGTTAYSPQGGEQARYQAALNMFMSGNIDPAMIEFQNIIREYPTGSYADNAQYWLGEAYLKKGDKNAAMAAFDTVIKKYPNSNKIADSYVKIGITQSTLGNKLEAGRYYNYVIQAFPSSSAANIARQRKLKEGII